MNYYMFYVHLACTVVHVMSAGWYPYLSVVFGGDRKRRSVMGGAMDAKYRGMIAGHRDIIEDRSLVTLRRAPDVCPAALTARRNVLVDRCKVSINTNRPSCITRVETRENALFYREKKQ